VLDLRLVGLLSNIRHRQLGTPNVLGLDRTNGIAWRQTGRRRRPPGGKMVLLEPSGGKRGGRLGSVGCGRRERLLRSKQGCLLLLAGVRHGVSCSVGVGAGGPTKSDRRQKGSTWACNFAVQQGLCQNVGSFPVTICKPRVPSFDRIDQFLSLPLRLIANRAAAAKPRC